MRIKCLCISVLRVASGPRVKLASCKSALTPPPPPPGWFTLLTVLRRWSRCLSYSLLLCGLLYETILLCLILFHFDLVFFSPFSIAITSLGEERDLILVLFVRLFDLCLFGLVIHLFIVVSGKVCGL